MDETTIARPRRGLRLVAALASLGLILALGACGDDDDDDAASDGGSDSAESSGDATLEIDSNSFTDVNAPAGGTLAVVNNTNASHTFTADDGAFDSEVGGGETVEVTVPGEAGEYPFHCEIHSSMEATLTVE